MHLPLPSKVLLLALGTTAFGFGALQDGKQHDRDTDAFAFRMVREGRQIFRFDTFGSEAFWGDTVRLHEAIAGSANGGVGPGVSPKQALSLGLKVDMNAVPGPVAAAIKAGKVDLDDPKNTLLLLRANAVVGVRGFFQGDRLKSVGITCAVCHSTVDDKFLPGIGNRLDGYPNRDLDIGKIVAAGPNLTPFTDLLRVDKATVLKVLNSWGPGKYDAELNLDGKAFRPDGKPAATLNPPALGLLGVNNHTWTGAWGNVTYWNAYVGNLQMHGQGTFFDPRLDDPKKYPVAARAKLGHKRDLVDMITAKLPALHFYQLSIPSPKPPRGTFDGMIAKRGETLFNGRAMCSNCHVPPIFTEPGWNLHKAEEIGIDDFQAMRSPDERYRTTPLRALWDTKKMHKGGFYHDGRFQTLRDVINHYDNHFKLNLSEAEKRDLEEYLKSI
jgi:hypothetical protein